MSRKCAGLKPTPARAGRFEIVDIWTWRAAGGMRSASGMARVSFVGQDLIGSSEPVPFGVLIVVHVPFATYFQALPWWSALAVPAQVVPAPAAQSLSPFIAMP